MTTETRARWRNVGKGLYFESPGVYGADKLASFPTADAAKRHAAYLNALEDAAAALQEEYDWEADMHDWQPGCNFYDLTVEVAEEELTCGACQRQVRMNPALARLRELRDA